jgi:hypothetical protein
MLGEDANSFNKGLLYSWPRSYQGIDKQHYQNADGSQNPQEGYPFLYQSVHFGGVITTTTQRSTEINILPP